MKFKAKLRRIGNSQGIYIPLKVITGYNLGDEIEVDVITKDNVTTETQQEVITKPIEKPRLSNRYEMCPKHPGSIKTTCGCE